MRRLITCIVAALLGAGAHADETPNKVERVAKKLADKVDKTARRAATFTEKTAKKTQAWIEKKTQ
jgi:hypothetical protein